MILLIDNYDSFTFNLYQYLCELGAEVDVRRNDQITIGEIDQMQPERIVVSPGPCTPAEAGISVDVFRRFSGEIPLLGVCLGHQSLAVAFGGSVVRAPSLMHGKISSISHDGRGLYRGIPNPFVATRYHSLIVDEETLPSCLEVSARSEHGLIMGLRHRVHDVEGVQFHPESILTEAGKDLLANFLGRPASVLAVRGY